jgi:TP901-1 family phage major tail protein
MTTGFSGRKLLLQRGDGASSESFTTVAALRTNTITFNETEVDITNKDSSGARELLSGSIVKSMSVTGSGIFTDVAAMQSVYSDYDAGTHSNYQIDLVSTDATTGGEVYTAAFRVTTFEFAGDYDGEVNYTLTLESDGAVTTTA